MKKEKITYVPFDKMEKFIISVMKGVGVNIKDAQIIAEVLIESDKRGIDSHGISRLKKIYYDRIKQGILNPKTKIDIVKQTPSTAVIDANNGMGMIASKKAMEIAIKKAKKYGTSCVVVKNSSHYGIAGYYSLMATEKNMIGINTSNARPSAAPLFGCENMLGTNPISIGIPSDEDFPFLLDCATSVTQRGKIELYARENREVPNNWVIDYNGRPMVDPNKILIEMIKGKASFIPIGGIYEETGGHKGYGLSLALEILSAALQNGNYMKMLSGFDKKGKKIPYRLGHFFLVIDVSHFIDIKVFKKITGNILRDIRNSKKSKGKRRIYTPGEKEYIAYNERKTKGVPVNNELMNEIRIMEKELGLKKMF